MVYIGFVYLYGEGLWLILVLGIGYGEIKIIEIYDFFKLIVEDISVLSDFEDGY